MSRTRVAALLAGVFAVGLAAEAGAQQMVDNPECLGSQCGKPKEEGGGGGGGGGGSVWVAYTDDGVTLSYSDDADGDGIADTSDNCPFSPNRDQLDSDADGVGDACDNCPTVVNGDQADRDGDGQGDACDEDIDGDGVPNGSDNCETIPNKNQRNTRAAQSLPDPCDGRGDACCDDDDGDGVLDAEDNCPLVNNPDQMLPADTSGCTADADGDGVSDVMDNCLDVANPDQSNLDGDAFGDACDPDRDNDGILNGADVCPDKADPDQRDSDRDGVGDACDTHYCFVLDKSNPDACLDPRAPFQVAASAATLSAKKGETVRLPHIFANRNNVAIEFEWTVKARPEGSEAAIANPVGAVSLSKDWQYAYVDGEVPTFEPDVDGDYQFQLNARLVFPDRLYSDAGQASARTSALLQVEGGTANTGCSAAAGAPALWGLLALLALRRRR